MKIYTCFLHNVTQCFDKFNLIFQNKAPILFKLNDSVEELLHDIARKFRVPKVLKEQNVKEIDVSNPEIQCGDEELFVGFLTRRHLASEEALPSHKTVLQRCQSILRQELPKSERKVPSERPNLNKSVSGQSRESR